MSKNYTRFTLGDTVKLKRNIGTVLAGTIGVIVRADDDGWLWVNVASNKEHSDRCVMTVDWLDNLEKIEDIDMETKK